MKLRFKGNSLRLRLNQTEVKILAGGAVLEEQVIFPGDARFSYALEASSATAADATFRNGLIHVNVPDNLASEWASCEQVGMYFEIPAAVAPLRIAIEKDFECMDGPDQERDPDAFPRAAGVAC